MGGIFVSISALFDSDSVNRQEGQRGMTCSKGRGREELNPAVVCGDPPKHPYDPFLVRSLRVK